MQEDVNTDSSVVKEYKPWQFKKGQSGNPAGRPKGSKSLKTYVKEMLHDMNDDEKIEFLQGIDKKTLWEMAEGKPKQDIGGDLTITEKLVKLDE